MEMSELTVGVTASRRAEQLAGALRRAGATPVLGSTVGGDVPEPDPDLAATTDRILAKKPEWLVATTGMGMKLWIEAAERTGRVEGLRALAEGTRTIARGNKAVAGLRDLDVDPEWVSEVQTDADVVRWLAERAEPGDVVAVQLHGSPTDHPYGELPSDVELVTITPYRSVLPDDTGPAQALIRAVLAGEIDVMTFTSPGAARGLFGVADEMDDVAPGALEAALDGPVAVAAIGPVTGGTLAHHGATVRIQPDRYRTGDLVRAIEAWVTGTTRPART